MTFTSAKIVLNIVDDLEKGDLPLSNLVLSKLDSFLNGSNIGNFVCGIQVNITAAHFFDHGLAQWGMLMTPATLNATGTW